MGKSGFRLTEAQIQISIVDLLSSLSRVNRFAFHSIPNEALGSGRDRRANAIRMQKLKRMGLTPGAGDLEIIKLGRAYYMEVKRPGEKPSDNQTNFMLWIQSCGAEYSIVHSVDQAILALKAWKIIP